MLAEIIHISGRDVTCFAKCNIDPQTEKLWNTAILAACPQDGSCSVDSGHLTSMLAISPEIRKVLGGQLPEGVVIGVRVSDRMLQRIESSDIKTFNLEFDEQGVEILSRSVNQKALQQQKPEREKL